MWKAPVLYWLVSSFDHTAPTPKLTGTLETKSRLMIIMIWRKRGNPNYNEVIVSSRIDLSKLEHIRPNKLTKVQYFLKQFGKRIQQLDK
jgi:hypothetical protein